MNKLAIILSFYLLFGCNSHSDQRADLPAFNILLADSATRLNMGEIKGGMPIVLLYFSPDCEHCQKETEAILQNMNALKTVQFYFVTNEPFDRLKIFEGYYKLDKYPNITLGRDDQFFLFRHLKGIAPPYLILYDREKKQIAAFHGDVAIDNIISSISNL